MRTVCSLQLAIYKKKKVAVNLKIEQAISFFSFLLLPIYFSFADCKLLIHHMEPNPDQSVSL